jgi:hypothetical protein
VLGFIGHFYYDVRVFVARGTVAAA